MHRFRLAARTLALAGVVALLAPLTGTRPAAAAPSPPPMPPVVSDGLDLSNLDPTCPACTNFYQFADGKYDANHPIPADRAEFGSFDSLSDHQLDVVHGILEAAATSGPTATPGEQKLGTFYKACMDTPGRNAAGLTPLGPELARIDAIHDVPSLTAELASLQRLTVPVAFSFGSEPDPKHSEMTIAGLSDGSLGLPEREYYLRSDAKSLKERADYVKFVASYLALADATIAGAAPAAAASPPPATVATAMQILAFETALARLQPTRAARRDPVANYHYVSFDSLQDYAVGLDWHAYFTALGAPPLANLDVARPDYVIAATKVLVTMPLATLRSYLRFRLLRHYANQLPAAFDDASFAFFRTELTGTTKQRPQWQRCVFATQADLQDLVSVVYAAKAFTPAAKARALALITNVHRALRDDLSTLAWMAPPTRRRAESKLAAMVKKIGYPDRPLDYTALNLSAGPYVQQTLATDAFGVRTDLARIGKPTDRTVWGMTAPEVNAYYDSSNNEIVFPAGILGAPFFDPAADDAVNYGGIGAVMGHETTHGFDDEGRQFDEIGNLTDWWLPSDAAAFKTRAKCVADQYASYPIAGVHLNGDAVEGEAIADLGGLTLAYRAFEQTKEAKAGKKIGGYTPEQRFFLSFAQVWADNQRAAAARDQALTDPHPVAMWRVIGTLSNMPEFQKAFHCKALDAMVRKARCQIW